MGSANKENEQFEEIRNSSSKKNKSLKLFEAC